MKHLNDKSANFIQSYAVDFDNNASSIHTAAVPVIVHYREVIIDTMASQITSLTIVYLAVYSAQIIENIKAPRHSPLCGESTVDRWNPRTNGQ